MNSKKKGEEIKGYITFKIDLNRFTDHLYFVMDSEICGDLEPIQIYIYNDDEDMIRLVSDFNFKEDGSIDECGNSTIIPKCVVKEVKEVS